MKAMFPSLVVLIALVGCGGEEQAAQPSPEKIEKMRQQYMDQAKAFNAETTPKKR
jgi:hypothetical protein